MKESELSQNNARMKSARKGSTEYDLEDNDGYWDAVVKEQKFSKENKLIKEKLGRARDALHDVRLFLAFVMKTMPDLKKLGEAYEETLHPRWSDASSAHPPFAQGEFLVVMFDGDHKERTVKVNTVFSDGTISTVVTSHGLLVDHHNYSVLRRAKVNKATIAANVMSELPRGRKGAKDCRCWVDKYKAGDKNPRPEPNCLICKGRGWVWPKKRAATVGSKTKPRRGGRQHRPLRRHPED